MAIEKKLIDIAFKLKIVDEDYLIIDGEIDYDCANEIVVYLSDEEKERILNEIK